MNSNFFTDIKQYIGHPSVDACYAMLRGSILELKTKGVITCNEPIHPLSVLKLEKNNLANVKNLSQSEKSNGHCNGFGDKTIDNQEVFDGDTGSITHFSSKLYEEAQRCKDFSGRTLRKLPFLAMTEFHYGQVSSQDFLKALHKSITSIQNDLKKVESK